MTVEITKENFCALVDNIERYYRFLEKLEEVSQIDFFNSSFCYFLDQVSNFLVELFFPHSSDSRLMNDIDYYMYELDFGKKWKPGYVIIDDKDMPLRNSEDLWNILTLGENDET